MNKYIAIDVGGSKMLGAQYDEEGQVLKRYKVKTKAHRGRKPVFETLLSVIDQLFDPDVVAMGILMPGVIQNARRVEMCSNIPFEKMDLAELIEEKYPVPVLLGNDVDLAVLGEWKQGGYTEQHVVGIFVGTGVGGGFIFHGQLYTGQGGAAEIGHMPYKRDGLLCGCGQFGCLETVAAKSGMLQLIEKERKKGTESILFDTLIPGEMFHTTDLYRAWQKGDPLARKVISKSVEALGYAVGTLNTLLRPELFIFGGGVMESFYDEICEELHEKALAHTMPALRDNVRFIRSFLGDDAGITGAYYLAKEASLGRRL
ncbi:MAG TPA: ROK family protein [Tissierellia bacterium]|jgi:glucokinase|nr:ROK family protein [Tissierellia bacterium]